MKGEVGLWNCLARSLTEDNLLTPSCATVFLRLLFFLIILSMHSVHCFQIPTYWFSQFMVQHSHIPLFALGLNVFIIISNANSFKNTLEMPLQTLQKKRTGLSYQLEAVIILPFKIVMLKDTVCWNETWKNLT